MTQLARGDVRLPGRSIGARARLERAESAARAARHRRRARAGSRRPAPSRPAPHRPARREPATACPALAAWPRAGAGGFGLGRVRWPGAARPERPRERWPGWPHDGGGCAGGPQAPEHGDPGGDARGVPAGRVVPAALAGPAASDPVVASGRAARERALAARDPVAPARAGPAGCARPTSAARSAA